MANADAVNWVKMTKAFLTREDVNVVRVDWHKGKCHGQADHVKKFYY
jgi:hypothetical protein